MDGRFVQYQILNREFISIVDGSTFGSKMPRASWEFIGGLKVTRPPLSEQKSIAEFLDRETGKIDELVAEQRRLIELLKEKRQAVISHAVTKGLNPHAPMKPSGIEWLGDVPAHWSVGSLTYYSKIVSGSTPKRDTPAYWGGEIPWVKTGEVNYSTITHTEETITEEALTSCAVSLAKPGTLLMALYGQGLTRGRVAILGISATFNQACAAISPDRRIDSGFLHAVFVCAYEFIRGLGNETTQMNLNLNFVQRFRVPVPPTEEQTEIVAFIKAETAKFDTLTAEAQRAIDLLQERRTALISAAVTGQIDVRKPPKS
jgi:type I restriction enzyme S subunit